MLSNSPAKQMNITIYNPFAKVTKSYVKTKPIFKLKPATKSTFEGTLPLVSQRTLTPSI